jgi:WD40 repeat protein
LHRVNASVFVDAHTLLVEAHEGALPAKSNKKGKPMRSQPFTAIALLTASVSMTSLTTLTPSAAWGEPAKKEAIRTDRDGDPLPKGAIMRMNRESKSSIYQVVYSPDSKVLAVEDTLHQKIEIWDTAKGRKVVILRPKGGQFRAMAFSPNGKQLTTLEAHIADGKDIICHWQPQTGSRQKEFSYEGGERDTLSYSADGETLACLDTRPREVFILWNAATG